MNWDGARIARGLVLAAWAGFFAYLWISGRATTYIGPKTSWVVTLGALTLPIVAIAYLSGARGRRRALTTRELGANALIITPILLALMVPAPTLGALAAKNKSTKNAAAPIAAAPVDGPIRLYEIAWAAESKKYASISQIKAGDRVDFVGFVSKIPAAGQLELSRFFVSCCAADATAYSVKVSGAPSLPTDTWVQVKGRLAGRPGYDLTVAAESVTKVDTPDNPYG